MSLASLCLPSHPPSAARLSVFPSPPAHAASVHARPKSSLNPVSRWSVRPLVLPTDRKVVIGRQRSSLCLVSPSLPSAFRPLLLHTLAIGCGKNTSPVPAGGWWRFVGTWTTLLNGLAVRDRADGATTTSSLQWLCLILGTSRGESRIPGDRDRGSSTGKNRRRLSKRTEPRW